MPRSLGKYTIGFDARTGRKVRYEDLVEDGENPGLLVHRSEADQEHPQKRQRPIGPDMVALYRPSPESQRYDTRIVLTFKSRSTNLWEGKETVPVNHAFTADAGSLTVDTQYGFGDVAFGAIGFGSVTPDGVEAYGDGAYGDSGYGSAAEVIPF